MPAGASVLLDILAPICAVQMHADLLASTLPRPALSVAKVPNMNGVKISRKLMRHEDTQTRQVDPVQKTTLITPLQAPSSGGLYPGGARLLRA